MALNQTQAQIAANIQKLADVQGTNALLRHPLADIYEYINRGVGAFHRLVSETNPDQRLITSSTVTTSSGTATYALPSDFDHMVSFDLTANGTKVWLQAYELHERPMLTDSSSSYAGIPFTYRLQGANIELLPTPTGVYTGKLWYIPAPTMLATDGSAASTNIDTINRLDEFLIYFGARLVATKDKNWDLANECTQRLQEMTPEIQAIARSRDKNSPPRIVDEMLTNRWGRRVALPRRWWR